jgi:hypothetical protein
VNTAVIRKLKLKLVIGSAVAIATTDRNVFFGNDGEDTETGHGINGMDLEGLGQCGCTLFAVRLFSLNFKFSALLE